MVILNKRVISVIISIFISINFFYPDDIKFKDGKYIGEFECPDGEGWKPELIIMIKDGKIIDARFNSINISGTLKTEDKNYTKLMIKSGNIPPDQYAKELRKRLIEKQSADVDTVAGATVSSNYFNLLAENILHKAYNGDKSKTILPMNDTYKAEEKNYDSSGYRGIIFVTFENGKITKIIFDEFNKDNKSIKSDNSYKEIMADNSTDIISFLEKSIIEVQNPENIDVISGATILEKRFINLLNKAISQRSLIH
jgi:sex pheromone cAD1